MPKTFLSFLLAGLFLFGTYKDCVAQKPLYRNLVFEGAGIRGIAYAGVVQELEAAGIMQHIQGFAGTSAGAITALLLSIGYTGAETGKVISDTRFQRFNDGRFFFIGGLYRMQKNFGWYRGKAFDRWLAGLISRKTGNANLSFAQLYARTGKELCITATSFNRQKALYFSRHTYPDMQVRDAVRISMSVPLYFEAIRIDRRGVVQPAKNRSDSLDVVGDGGVLANFPIGAFDRLEEGEKGLFNRVPNPQTLGVRIDSDPQITNDKTTRELALIPIHSLRNYVNAFYVLSLENLNRSSLTETDWARTLSVSDAEIGPMIKKLTKAQKEALLQSGRKHAHRFLLEKGFF